MIGVNKCIYIVCLFLISSCCSVSDSTVPSGYPFNGDSRELNFHPYRGVSATVNGMFLYKYYKSFDLDTLIIRDSMSDISFFRPIDSNYVSTLDFDKYNLIFVSGIVEDVFTATTQERFLINHKNKTCSFELRAHIKRCNSGMNSDHQDFITDDTYVVPKIPEGYSFLIQRFYPIENSK